ncbi:MAG: DNA topoisomerase IV, partial [Leptolyngbyaceae cyanobacterium SL_7_1]|nr:DNA topoisomerase IV [Leptolyngbyaceae cyanobacterium SL_7_1]
KDLRALKRKHGDARRTRIQTAAQRAAESAALAEAIEEVSEEALVLEFTQRGYVRRSTLKAFQRQQAKQESLLTTELAETEDVTLQIESTTTKQDLLMLTRSGKAYTVAVGEISNTTRQSKGTPLVTLLPPTAQGDPEAIAAQFILAPPLENQELVLVTQQGRIKRLPLTEFANLTGRGLMAMKLKEDDELQSAILVQSQTHLIVVASGGRLLRFAIDDEQLPIQSRTTQGLQALRLSKQEQMAGGIALNASDEFLVLSAQGFAKRLKASQLRIANRGELGVQAMQFATKTDKVIGIAPAPRDAELTILTNTDRVARVPIDQIALMGRDGSGDRLVKLGRGEKLMRWAIVEVPLAESD